MDLTENVTVAIEVPQTLWEFYVRRFDTWDDPERSASYDFIDGGIRAYLDAIDLNLDPEARRLKPLVEAYLEGLKRS